MSRDPCSHPTVIFKSDSPLGTGINPASIDDMIIAMGIAGFSFASAALLITGLRKAPESFEDHPGFHDIRGTATPREIANFETPSTGAVTVQQKSSFGELALQYPTEHPAR